jgi:hemoglobin/transferrin/lactoferrin receptor protein
MPKSALIPAVHPLVLAMACALPGTALAQQGPDGRAAAPYDLDRVVVVASKVAEPLRQVAATVDVVDRAEIERRQVQDLPQLVRYQPGVDVPVDAARFGPQGLSIRGLDGNRVGMEVDGVPVADAFSVGQFAAAGRDLLEVDAVQRVEILRGPASTLYGSDALAGVVVFRTRDPQDLLDRVDASRYVGGRVGWSSLDNGRLASVAVAGGARLQGLLQVSRREGNEAGNMSTRMPANPAAYRRDGILAKVVLDEAAAARWTATFDHASGEVRTDVRSLRFGPGRFNTTTSLLGDDRFRRDRLSLQGDWGAGGWLDASQLLLYAQRNHIRQDTAQERLADRTTRFPSLRERRFELDQDGSGIEWMGQVRRDGGRLRHWHVFGIEYAVQRYSGLRDGRETNLATGATSNVVLGERFPVRDFPTSRSRTLGLFWQDEIGIGDAFAVVPGVRWERYRLDAEADALFREDYPTVQVHDLAHAAWTPKLGLRWTPGAHATWFLQYARGFRAPPFGDVNIGLSLQLLNYEVRPNPGLKPETSQGLETGWRWQGERLQASVSAYRNDYRDLIESRANLGVDPASGALVFQSVNRARASIRGIEAQLDCVPDIRGEWRISASAAWARGRDEARDRPLNSVAPGKLVLGASWEPASDRVGLEVMATVVARQGALDESASPLFHAPGHAVLDAYAWWRLAPGLRLQLAARNLADRRYWDWNAARNVNPADASPPLDFYTRPGRSVAATLVFDW